MKNLRDAGFSRKRGGNAGSGLPLPDPLVNVNVHERKGRFSSPVITL